MHLETADSRGPRVVSGCCFSVNKLGFPDSDPFTEAFSLGVRIHRFFGLESSLELDEGRLGRVSSDVGSAEPEASLASVYPHMGGDR